jgi:polyisoprenoid-binding protein YceI
MGLNRRWAGWGLLAVVTLAVAAPLPVGPATKSTLTATFRQQGVAVENPFTKWSGRIEYDPQNVAAATAQIDVEMASYDIGDPLYAAELAKKSWFDTGTHPTGTFRSTAIKAVSATRFEATGTLTLKGKSQAITFPVTVGTAGGATTFDGGFTISRKAFGIGDPVWDDAVDDKITVKFHLVGGR